MCVCVRDSEALEKTMMDMSVEGVCVCVCFIFVYIPPISLPCLKESICEIYVSIFHEV